MTAPVAEGIPSMRTKQIHSKIYVELQHRITSGGLKPGDLLPSEAELCEEFDASRGPVRQAIASLRAEGLISSGRGRRSVVLGTSKADSFMSILSKFAWMKEHDLNPTSKILWMARRPAPAHVAAALGMKPDDPIIFFPACFSQNPGHLVWNANTSLSKLECMCWQWSQALMISMRN